MIPIHPTLYGCTLQGTVALMSRANQKTLSFASKPKPLSARWVLDQFRAITITKGSSCWQAVVASRGGFFKAVAGRIKTIN